MEVKSYICPSCGSVMEFDAAEQKMVCRHCGTKMGVTELEQHYQDIHGDQENGAGSGEEPGVFSGQDSPETVRQEEGEKGSFKVYRCSGCGAEVMTDEFTAATFCSFCGRPSLMEDRLSGVLMPQYVIPFKIKKDDAVETYKKWASKGKFTPSLLKSQATIDKITGMYVPFWLYDYVATIAINANCTRVKRHVRGEYEIIDTDHYSVMRDIEAEFDQVPADASEKMPDDIMDKLEPFSYSDMIKFEMPYLSGYYSERYNYTSQDMIPRIESRINDYIDGVGMDTIASHHYTTVNVVRKHVRMKNLNASYALFPVWILNYTYNGVTRMFALNGQTGKIVADRPVSKAKMGGYFSGIAAVLFGIFMMLGRFFGK